MDDDDQILSVPETADMLGVSVRSVDRWRTEGEKANQPPLPYVRMGVRRIGYRRGDVKAFIRSNTHASLAAELSRGSS